MKHLLFFIAFISAPLLMLGQEKFSLKDKLGEYLQSNLAELGLVQDDILDYHIYRQYNSKKTELTHVFLQQNHEGIPIHKAEIRLHWREDKGWLKTQNSFIGNLSSQSFQSITSLNEIEAIEQACLALNIEYSKPTRISLKNEATLLYKADFSIDAIPVKAAYFQMNNTLRRVWDLSIYEKDATDCWNVLVDASTGEILRKYNWVQHCSFNTAATCNHTNHDKVEAIVEFNATPVDGATYNVFAVPLESPSHGDRTMEVTPNNLVASPFGWHDTNALEGPEYFITRGNNVHAYPDLNDTGASQGNEPDGGAELHFDFEFDGMTEPDQNLDAATVNLFYMNNMMHDVWYQYGFDPASGNFQYNNYGESGFGGDYVLAQAQDSSGVNENIALNNANFYTPSDGTNPVMQMFIWDKPVDPFDLFTVNSPEQLAGVYEITPTSGWAGEITSTPLTAEVVNVDDGSAIGIEGCGEILNDLTGKIALVSRGTCEFGLKALNAQNAGAVAVIIFNNVGGMLSIASGSDGAEVTIPTVFMGKVNGDEFYNFISEDGVINATFVNNSPPGPAFIDSDFDNGIIAHEYGHGISNRLTGGNCLSGDEQAGEGWSDFFALAMTAKEGDSGDMSRGIGTYVSAENNEGRGIRSYPYSRDMGLNPMTYDNIITESVPHGVGSVWATMIWDLYWNFVDVYGYDTDRYNGTGGNNMVMQLVIDGLKLQACNASFTEMRGAIILADELLYNGENACMIWETFARRGLGYSANAGSANDRGDGFEAFDNIPECIKTLKIVKSAKPDAKSSEDLVYTLNIYNHTPDSTMAVYVIDTLQSDVTFISESSTCEVQADGNVLTFTLGDLQSGDAIECTYSVSPSENLFSEIIFEDDMEEDDYFWVTWADEGLDPEWALIDFDAHSGEYAWNAPNVDYRTVSYLGLEPFTVQGNAPTLSFWHQYDTEASYNGGYISISTDEQNYSEVGSDIIRGHYRGVSQASPPLGGIDSYWGNSNGFINTLVDLSNYMGETITIRFTYVTDDGNSTEEVGGWTIDDVRIIDRFQVENTACVYSSLGNADCDEVQQGGTIINGTVYGCTNNLALNYNPLANVDNGTCIIEIYGCTDSSANNYDSLASINNGICDYSSSNNTELLSVLEYSVGLNDVWGYVDNTSREYAIVGLETGTSFVEVTDPTNPIEMVQIPGPTSTWRDIKTWGNYAYIVHDSYSSGESQGLLIVNLEGLGNGNVSYSSFYHDNQILRAHNIYIDENGVLYVFGGDYSNGGVVMFDVSTNPEEPIYLGEFEAYYLHDGMVRGDTLWGSAIYAGLLIGVDVSDKQNSVILGSHATPNNFTHNCWVSDDGLTVYTTDEVSGAYISSYDISDINNIEALDQIQSWSNQTNVIPHNTHVKGDYLINSYYCDGVTIVDASDPSNLEEVAFYDTSPDYSGGTFNGAWGAYPWLPSNNLLVTDRENGLHIISILLDDYNTLLGCTNEAACNYNPTANTEDSSCVFTTEYFDCFGNCILDSDLDGICDELEINGCTDSAAINYDINATDEDNSCQYICEAPSTWNVTLTGENMTVLILPSTEITINSESPPIGSAIGVFFTNSLGDLQCAGAGYTSLNGETTHISVMGDDSTTDEIDGFIQGQELIWMIWNGTLCEEYTVYPDFSSGSNFYSNNGIIILESLERSCQQIVFPGSWYMFSTNIFSENMDVTTLFEQIEDNLIIIKDNLGNAYLPEYTFNGIGNIEITQGYQIKTNEIVQMEVCGQYVVPEEQPIYLSSGWNLISYLRTVPASVDQIFLDLVEQNNLVILKNYLGDPYLPNWDYNSIGDMSPGQGYQLKINETDTLHYLPNDQEYRWMDSEVINNKTIYYPTLIPTDNNMHVVIPNNSWDIRPTDGSEIAVYSIDGLLVGTSKYTSPTTVVTIWGNDAMTLDKNGLTKDEEFRFTLLSDDIEKEMKINRWEKGLGLYNNDAVDIIGSIETINYLDKTTLFDVIPNPSKTKTTISFYVSEQAEVNITLHNILGELIEVIANSKYTEGLHKIEMNVSHLEAGSYFYTMTTADFKQTNQLIIVKE
ncbi:choice-of-anchor B family protein [bacterium]|nr:choice-of-anchor B family protein [bacterium]